MRHVRSPLVFLALATAALAPARRPIRNAEGDKSDKGTATPTTPTQTNTPAATFTEADVKERVDAAVKNAVASTLKELGVEKLDDAKGALKAHREGEEAKKSEIDRYKGKVDELAPRAKRADVLEGTLKRYLDAEEGAIPKEKKDLLDLAPSAEHPEARLEWIVNARKKGLFTPVQEPAAKDASTKDATKDANKAPANTRAGGTPPPATTPAAKRPKDMTDAEFKAYMAQRNAERTAR